MGSGGRARLVPPRRTSRASNARELCQHRLARRVRVVPCLGSDEETVDIPMPAPQTLDGAHRDQTFVAGSEPELTRVDGNQVVRPPCSAARAISRINSGTAPSQTDSVREPSEN